MQFQAQFVRFRTEDKRPVPIAFPVQVIAPDAEQAMGKLKRFASADNLSDGAANDTLTGGGGAGVLAGGFDADTFVYLARAHAGREAAATNCTWITTIPRAD